MSNFSADVGMTTEVPTTDASCSVHPELSVSICQVELLRDAPPKPPTSDVAMQSEKGFSADQKSKRLQVKTHSVAH